MPGIQTQEGVEYIDNQYPGGLVSPSISGRMVSPLQRFRQTSGGGVQEKVASHRILIPRAPCLLIPRSGADESRVRITKTVPNPQRLSSQSVFDRHLHPASARQGSLPLIACRIGNCP